MQPLAIRPQPQPLLPGTVSVFTTIELEMLCAHARRDVFKICQAAHHGHVGGSSAAVELMTTLYFGNVLRFNPADPYDDERDRVLVRGHLGPLRYQYFAWLGWIEHEELWTYRRLGTRLHGHEDHHATPGVDLSPSGSLGMLLSYGTGAALAARNRRQSYRTFVFLGDGEEQEGVVSEAARHAAHLRLDNLIAVIDRNGKQLSNPVEEVDTTDLETLWRGYGWEVILLAEGHSIPAIKAAYDRAIEISVSEKRPVVIIANTVKGIGLAGAEAHYSGYHTISRCTTEVIDDGIRAIDETLSDSADALIDRIRRLTGERTVRNIPVPTRADLRIALHDGTPNHPDACQGNYFKQLNRRIQDGEFGETQFYFLTADVTTKGAVQDLDLESAFHFYNVGIREQHMVALAHGLSVTDPNARILINSFDAFNYRSSDQLNAALQGKGRFIILGDVSGLTNAQNGKTHQTTGLPSALLAMHGLTFLEPWDAQDTYHCLNWALGESDGIVYIRVHSSAVSQSPMRDCDRTLSYYTVHDVKGRPDLVMVGSGLTVGTLLEAAKRLKEEGIQVRVINVINPNSLDAGFVRQLGNGTPLLTAYNGEAKVLRQAVADSILTSGGVTPCASLGLGFSVGNTGTYEELVSWAGLDAAHMYIAARSLLGN